MSHLPKDRRIARQRRRERRKALSNMSLGGRPLNLLVPRGPKRPKRDG